MFAQDANNGRGVLLIDPHGELAEDALNLVPPRRIRKTIYLNPADTQWPIGFNVLDDVPAEARAARAADIVSAFRSIWASSWGPRLEHILYNTIAALLEVPGATLICIPRLLLNGAYRKRALRHITDPVIANFWRDEFPIYEKKFGAEAVSPILNKIGQLLASPIVRNMIGQPKTALNIRHLIDNNYIIIANFSKGILGDQHASLLGALLIASFGAAALSRADMRPADRKHFAVIVDEFSNYTTEAFTSLLSEARKYKLSLTLAHQYLDQMTPTVRSAILGNVGSIVAFRVGAQDAAVYANEFGFVNQTRVTDTPNYSAWCRLLQDGTYSDAFLLDTPKPPKPHNHGHKIISHSRIHFASKRADVEQRILRFLKGDERAKSDNELDF
jgi:hypothetical protein